MASHPVSLQFQTYERLQRYIRQWNKDNDEAKAINSNSQAIDKLLDRVHQA